MPYYHSDCDRMPSITKTPEDIVKERVLELSSSSMTQDISGITYPDINWGRVTHGEQIQGQLLVAETPHSAGSIDYQYQESIVCKGCLKYFSPHEHILSPPGYDASSCNSCQTGITLEQTDWHCHGCSKYFTTKASLKRHHDRKKSCKELCQKKEDLSGSQTPEVPTKPYIVDWIEELQAQAISGDSEKPYCKHCEVEFANKTNLSKHLSTSVACDKLAKQEFLKLLTN